MLKIKNIEEVVGDGKLYFITYTIKNSDLMTLTGSPKFIVDKLVKELETYDK